MNRLRKPAMMHALLGMAAAWGFTLGAAASTHAQTWSEYAMVSATMGVSDGRVCVGEGSRGDIGCPIYAPYVDPNTGNVGIGNISPSNAIDIQRSDGLAQVSISGYGDVYNAAALYLGNVRTGGAWYLTHRNTGYFLLQQFDGTSWYTRLAAHPDTGNIGIGTVNPYTRLSIAGSVRLGYETSSTLNTCDTNRTGAIKYQSGDFFYCRNGTAWESLTSLSGGGGTAGDRITSGTTGVYTYSNTSASIATAGVQRVVVGTSGNVGIGQQPVSGIALSTSGTSYFNGNVGIGTTLPTRSLHIQTTGTAAQFALLNPNVSGTTATLSMSVGLENTSGNSLVAGMYGDGNGYASGTLGFLETWGRGAPIWINRALWIASSSTGNVGIGTLSPTTKLEVSGTVSATLIKLANDPTDACTAATIGAIKSINGRIYVCRQ